MTAIAPKQMRALAKNLDGVKPSPAVWAYEADWARQASAALRAAADQLEAVRLQVTAAWDGGYAIGKAGGPSLNPFLTADTAPQSDD